MIRPVKVEDSEKIRVINKVELGYTVDIQLVKKQISKLSDDSKHFILVYEDELNHEVVGYIHAEVYESLYSNTGFNIIGLAVIKEFQNKGIGKQLLLALEDETKAREYGFIRFNSSEKRHDAHRFYNHLGYECDKLQKRFIKIL